jgi:hypothetical protein
MACCLLATSLDGLWLAAAAANSYNPLETPPSIDSATFIINAMPGSLDPLFDVLHGEGLILSKFASKLQLPPSASMENLNDKKCDRAFFAFYKISSLIMFYCSLLDSKKLFCYSDEKLDDLK